MCVPDGDHLKWGFIAKGPTWQETICQICVFDVGTLNGDKVAKVQNGMRQIAKIEQFKISATKEIRYAL